MALARTPLNSIAKPRSPIVDIAGFYGIRGIAIKNPVFRVVTTVAGRRLGLIPHLREIKFQLAKGKDTDFSRGGKQVGMATTCAKRLIPVETFG